MLLQAESAQPNNRADRINQESLLIAICFLISLDFVVTDGLLSPAHLRGASVGSPGYETQTGILFHTFFSKLLRTAGSAATQRLPVSNRSHPTFIGPKIGSAGCGALWLLRGRSAPSYGELTAFRLDKLDWDPK